jgi:hypothetical protein
MKRMITPFAIILFIMMACTGCKQSGIQGNDIITVDVTTKYPKKDLILQDFMDVEYIALETNDDFLCEGIILAAGKEIIIVKNSISDGDIFIFDRKGKGLKKINRKGQGGEEYTNILGITLDENNNEMFVNSHSTRRILVYDLDGNFKRSFKHKENAMYDNIHHFDQGNLICHDCFYDVFGTANELSFLIVSKQDGSIIKEIQIPFEKKKLTQVLRRDEKNRVTGSVRPSSYYPIIPSLDGWILVEPSADTVYRYLPDHTMTPFIVRSPSVQSMDPEVFLFPGTLTDRYYFMETVKKEVDFKTQSGFPGTDLMYDRQEKALFEYVVYNADYSDKREVVMKSNPVNEEIASWQSLEAGQLVEDYENGKLKGKLKEMAAELDENSNPVIMLLKHKK